MWSLNQRNVAGWLYLYRSFGCNGRWMFTNGKSEIAVYRQRLAGETSGRHLVQLEERRRIALFVSNPSAVVVVGCLQMGKAR